MPLRANVPDRAEVARVKLNGSCLQPQAADQLRKIPPDWPDCRAAPAPRQRGQHLLEGTHQHAVQQLAAIEPLG